MLLVDADEERAEAVRCGLEALAEAGIAHEVVPGITAALACAAQAGIPLTHRDCANSLTFVTGHSRDGELAIDAASLARPGQTIAVYMGITRLPELLRRMTKAGYESSTPAALIEQGGTPRQRTLRGSFAEVVAHASGWVSDGPALLLLGDACGRGDARQAAFETHGHGKAAYALAVS